MLATLFCKGNASMLAGAGAAGKTSVRIVQYLALTTDRNLTGEHVFKRSRVLLLSFEDDENELKRRIGAAMKYYGIDEKEVDGWLYFAALTREDGKIAVLDANKQVVPGELADNLASLIDELRLDLIGLDPFVKSHDVGENNNTDMDSVMEILTDIAKAHNIATDTIAHFNKGQSDPGDANRVRGASAQKDAARIVYTLTTMSKDEAQIFGISETDRASFVRMDRGKVNYGKADEAKWFQLVGVRLENCSVDPAYPNGDEVQVATPWAPPKPFDGLSDKIINDILDDIEKGLPAGKHYSASPAARARAAWKVVTKHASGKADGPAKEVVRAWLKSGLLIEEEYYDETRGEDVKGLRVDGSKRPGTES